MFGQRSSPQVIPKGRADKTIHGRGDISVRAFVIGNLSIAVWQLVQSGCKGLMA